MRRFLLIFLILFCRFLSAEILIEEVVVPARADAVDTEEDVFWFYEDRSIELSFHDRSMTSVLRKAGYTEISYRLRLHIPDIEEAESGTGLDVYCNGIKVGGLPGTRRNTWIEIELDISIMRIKRNMKFVLKPRGGDNLAISLPESGNGPEMKIIAFFEAPAAPE